MALFRNPGDCISIPHALFKDLSGGTPSLKFMDKAVLLRLGFQTNFFLNCNVCQMFNTSVLERRSLPTSSPTCGGKPLYWRDVCSSVITDYHDHD